MTRNTAVAVASLLLFGATAKALPPNPDEQAVPHAHNYESFDEAMKLLEKWGGRRVSCPSDTAGIVRKTWSKRKSPTLSLDPEAAEIPFKELIQEVSYDLALSWKITSPDGPLFLDIPWRASDSRPAAELLRYVVSNGCGPLFSKELNDQWQTAFNALLCKEGNFEKAALARQLALLDSAFRDLEGSSPPPLLMTPLIGADKKQYHLILIAHAIDAYPGHGNASYYWFREDGTLMGAGAMNTGHRCAPVAAAIDNPSGPRSSQTSEVQMILKHNLGEFVIARFVLEAEGLKLVHLTDATGKELEAPGYDIGKSLREK